MAENSDIEWCDHSFNPWIGCQKVSPECDFCYAEEQDNFRKWTPEGWGQKAPRHRTSASTWAAPRSYNRKADAFFAQHGRRQRVFCASLADVFDNAVDPQWRADLWDLIRECDNIDWLILTKRPQNIAKMLPDDWGDGWGHVWLGTSAGCQKTANQNIPPLLSTPAAKRFLSCEPMLGPVDWKRWLPTGRPARRPNGTEFLAPHFYMAKCDRCGWVGSSELCGSDHFGDDSDCYCPSCHMGGADNDISGLDWIICGGESGPNARPMHPEWARSLRDQCQAAGVPFFFKQWGEYADHTDSHGKSRPCKAKSDLVIDNQGRVQGGGAKGYGGFVEEDWREKGQAWMCKVGKKAAGRLLDGREWNEVPE